MVTALLKSLSVSGLKSSATEVAEFHGMCLSAVLPSKTYSKEVRKFVKGLVWDASAMVYPLKFLKRGSAALRSKAVPLSSVKNGQSRIQHGGPRERPREGEKAIGEFPRAVDRKTLQHLLGPRYPESNKPEPTISEYRYLLRTHGRQRSRSRRSPGVARTRPSRPRQPSQRLKGDLGTELDLRWIASFRAIRCRTQFTLGDSSWSPRIRA